MSIEIYVTIMTAKLFNIHRNAFLYMFNVKNDRSCVLFVAFVSKRFLCCYLFSQFKESNRVTHFTDCFHTYDDRKLSKTHGILRQVVVELCP